MKGLRRMGRASDAGDGLRVSSRIQAEHCSRAWILVVGRQLPRDM